MSNIFSTFALSNKNRKKKLHKNLDLSEKIIIFVMQNKLIKI